MEGEQSSVVLIKVTEKKEIKIVLYNCYSKLLVSCGYIIGKNTYINI